ncbi:MAG: DUF4870 domain-containing protein [Flavobacterium sp.]
MVTTYERNTATLLNLSTLTQYFIPFGNYLFPILIWSLKKDKSQFVDYNGKQTLNFQLSILLYSLVLVLIAVPTLIYSVFRNVTFSEFQNGGFEAHRIAPENITGVLAVALIAVFLFFTLKVGEFFLIINAAVKNSNGENYKYPLSISFLK